jgi:hypothetical protein
VPSSSASFGRGADARHATLAAPRKNKPASTPKAPALTCKLMTTEAPRGGRLEVEGTGLGQSPLVRIGGRVTRTIERTETRLAVQIHADSNGGPVTVVANKVEVACGLLTIIGKDQ